MTPPQNQNSWLFEITSQKKWFAIPFKALWQYRDLLQLLIHRDLTTLYKQTLLGPLWFFIQPLITAIIFTVVFNDLAGIQTGEIPALLFNLVSITIWNYFANCLTDTSDTFKKNAAIFGKVYFPRLLMPLTVVITNLAKMLIQLLLYFIFYAYYRFEGLEPLLSIKSMLFPLIVINMGLLGLSLGLIISSMVTKYRDLTFLVSFGVQLLLFASAVIYPMALIDQKIPNYSWLVRLNPLAYLVESSRYLLLNQGDVQLQNIFYTILITFGLLLLGLLMFHKTEKDFIDTI